MQKPAKRLQRIILISKTVCNAKPFFVFHGEGLFMDRYVRMERKGTVQTLHSPSFDMRLFEINTPVGVRADLSIETNEGFLTIVPENHCDHDRRQD